MLSMHTCSPNQTSLLLLLLLSPEPELLPPADHTLHRATMVLLLHLHLQVPAGADPLLRLRQFSPLHHEGSDGTTPPPPLSHLHVSRSGAAGGGGGGGGSLQELLRC